MKPKWRFGVGQTAAEERAEIKDAQGRGLEAEYMRGQRWERMREAERERKRARTAERRRRAA